MSSSDGGQSRKRLVVGVLSVCLLVAMVIGTVMFFVSEKAGYDSELRKRNMSKTMRSVELFCAPADYQGTCHETLETALSRTDPAKHPHAAAAAAITAVERALAEGFNRTSVLDAVRQSNDTLVWEAIHDCRMLLEDCRGNVERALSSIAWRGVEGPAQDLQAWLSAVITFQGSCVDMFPKGEVRDEVKSTMEKAREVSSNALAIIKQGAALASMLDLNTGVDNVDGKGNRQLEEDEESASSLSVPTWVPDEERKLLGVKGGRRRAALTPNVTVAKDGSGDFTNISAALDAMPEKYSGRYFIYVKEGVYDETVNITGRMANVTMYGDGSKASIVTGSKNVVDGIRMWRTATFAVDGDSFMAMKLGIRNTAGVEKQQALALRVKGDKAIFFNCRIEGNQDTLFAQAYRQFYRSCVISGTVDFIMGDAAAVFQRCLLVVRQPRRGQPAVVTAQARRDHQQTTGFVIHRSQIVADEQLLASSSGESGSAPVRTYLGRPWKEFARTVVMESTIDGFVHGQGYMPWEGKDSLGTAFFGEFRNAGDGANVTGRKDMQGFHVMGKDKALQFTVGHFLHGADWIPETGTPVSLGLSGEEE
ncbi:pectinesterase [Zea mays]|uniref:pectinesterase n=1 Tax=Zea mays TaxID=4577 RepID=A0A1D6P829_MAIZE|nr:pectinesterase [Zea mays]AQL05982.1 putative pectinesterase/pectinesterase inhibitor 13 [Zea mays]AQL05983.1 putative pectinesterase/pectinesterase inhibitor 13 [Zea mays]|eukprot:XP_008660035.1 pectinesterase [Zea mays]